ncbi:hypothetical protein GCM10027190_13920 [Spirosoma areae]
MPDNDLTALMAEVSLPVFKEVVTLFLILFGTERWELPGKIYFRIHVICSYKPSVVMPSAPLTAKK